MGRDWSAEAALADAAAKVFEQLGGNRVNPSVLMDATIPLDLSGEAVRSRLCVFPDARGHEIALRPDLTLPIALLEAEDRKAGRASGERTRRYVASAFRLPAAEGFDTEFTQVGFERYGAPSTVQIDVEMFAVALEAANVGTPDLETVWLGDLAVIPALVDAVAGDPTTADDLKRRFRQGGAMDTVASSASSATNRQSGLSDIVAKASRADAEILVGDLLAMAGVEPVGARGLDEIVDRLMTQSSAERARALPEASAAVLQKALALSGPAAETVGALEKTVGQAKVRDLDPVLARLVERLDALQAHVPGLDLRFAASFGRRFNYYDGFLFEVFARGAHPLAPLAAGGRYDQLIASLTDGAAAATAIGGVVRPDRMALASPEAAKPAQKQKGRQR
ncbi:MAG: ATP phosphoribosyltransferase regulatory subunit [Pseudomonadota bacterium]